MKTRKALFLFLLAIAACVAVWYCVRKPQGQMAVQPHLADTNRTNEKNPASVAPPAAASEPTSENYPAVLIEKRLDQVKEDRQKGLTEWRTPIEFYGKVVDENTNPVAAADIHFEWTDLSSQGSSERQTTSDEGGLFSLRNEAGKHLVVKVFKPGYYVYQPFGSAFSYAGENQSFVPDSTNPVLFRLKKKGVAESLIVLDKNIQISVSGKPLAIDLRTGEVASPTQETVIMEFVKQPSKPDSRLYDWSFKITVPDGGLLISTNEFGFQAPQSGYMPSDMIEMKSSPEENWQSRMKREYFVKLADGKFARLILDLMSHNGSLKVQAFLNTSGSRNLEFDPGNAIPAGQ